MFADTVLRKRKKNMRDNTFNKSLYLSLVTAAFLLWSATFVWRTSFIGIDERRHFCLFDDAMISMRYAWNLAHGSGLVWNEGVRVEGFTNLLMTLYMSLGAAVFGKGAAVLFIQFSGIGFMLGVAYFTMKVAGEALRNSESGGVGFIETLSFAAALFYYPLAYWSLMGMETGMLAALLLSATWYALHVDDSPRFAPALPVLMGLAFLTRQDALIPISLLMLYRAAAVLKGKGGIDVVLKEAALFGAFVASLTLFRWYYYGEIVPNTYLLKMGSVPLALRLKNGVRFVLPFIASVSLPIVVALLGVALNFHRKSLLLIALFLSSVGYQIWIGGDPWPYWRITSPFVPLLFVLCIGGAWNVVQILFGEEAANGRTSVRTDIPRLHLKKVGVACVTIIALVIADLKFLPEMFPFREPFYVSANRRNVNIAIALKELCSPEASIAVTWAGAIPYYTGLRAIDILGKSDKYIARRPPQISRAKSELALPGHNKVDLRYSVIRLQPTYAQTFGWGLDDIDAYGRRHYEKVEYKGVELRLLKDAKGALWQFEESHQARDMTMRLRINHG